MKPIKNKERYPDIDWLDEAKSVGDIGGIPLVLIGHEQGTDEPILARDIRNDYYAPVSLSELTGHCQEPIKITGSLDRA